MTLPTRILHGDNLALLPTLAEASIDTCVTDPPYGIRFMGKAWDGADIQAKAAARRRQAQNPDGIAGPNGEHNSLAAEAGKYDRSSQASQAFQEFSETWGREVFRVLKPGAWLISFASTRTFHRMVCGLEDAGFEIRDTLAWCFFSGFPKSLNLSGNRKGWGTALKPAFEPIVLARKPLDGTVAENIAHWGTGALNIDGCRVPLTDDDALQDGTDGDYERLDTASGGWGFKRVPRQPGLGRWPANIIHDGSPEVVAIFPHSNGAAAPVRGTEPTRNGFSGPVAFSGIRARICSEETFRNDSGSAARFFFAAKASTADRDVGCEHLPKKSAGDLVERTEGSAGINNPRAGAGRTSGGRANCHPTVKPTELMRYLCRLVTPPGGTVLDPFMGSGSTGRGAVLEGFGFVGMELESDYFTIAQARIDHAVQEHRRANAQQTLSL